MNNIKTTDIIVAVSQTLREHANSNLASEAAINVIVKRVLELLEQKQKKVLLD